MSHKVILLYEYLNFKEFMNLKVKKWDYRQIGEINLVYETYS